MSYESWKILVDAELLKMCGFEMDDLPDWLSRDAYEDDTPPRAAAIMCLENAGIEFTLLDEP